ncbi:MAG TPA: glycosyltransferase family 39 protein [Solirubrobacteraceae bacterium]|nr:glycosyltransferase family 39 protein [Solirubrobacteraceae bacterium]
MNGAALEEFYGAAARSMSTSWHDFFFGAFDPAATVSIDKLPGALWPQALLMRIAGFHVWAIVLPQAIEGVIAILVLYRAVRRLAGPLAAIVAALALAASPVTIALNRGNVADSLLIMLIVLAADATTSALLSGRLRTLLLAGVWVGLAFQAKMMVAWLVLPALAGAYLIAAPPRLRLRVGHVALAGLVTVAVSLSWMTVVTLVPAHDRPYVDGTQNNSVFSQTFQYNGFARFGSGNVFAGAGHPAEFLVRLSETNAAPAHKVKPSWHRLLGGLFGRDDGWLLPAALISALAVLFARRRAGRRDPLRALVALWGVWLLVLAAFFSAAGHPNSYYVAALSPATGAVCGAGAALAHRAQRQMARLLLAATVICCVSYGIVLLHGGVGVPAWLTPVALVLSVLGTAALLARSGAITRRLPIGRLIVASACILVLPAVASATIVAHELGPFAAPYEAASATVSAASEQRSRAAAAQAVEELSSTYETPVVLVTDSSILAAPYILATGREILPIGGYQGGAPSPTLADLRRRIAAQEVRAFLVPELGSDPRTAWITKHCKPVEAHGGPPSATATALYDCAGA